MGNKLVFLDDGFFDIKFTYFYFWGDCWEYIVNMINQNQKNIEMFQEQINRLITLLEKKYN